VNAAIGDAGAYVDVEVDEVDDAALGAMPFTRNNDESGD
jgi:hypothetical protein